MADSTAPTVYYLGNKAKSAELIDHVCTSHFGTSGVVLDLFAGSGSISRQFAQSRRVIANDIQTYSHVLCTALLMGEQHTGERALEVVTTKRFRDTCDFLKTQFSRAITAERNISPDSDPSEVQQMLREIEYISKEGNRYAIVSLFGGRYFSMEQACELQSMLEASRNLTGQTKFHFLAALISTASRITYTVGNQFAQPIKWINTDGSVRWSTVKKFSNKRSANVIKTFIDCLSIYSTNYLFSQDNTVSNMTDLEAISKFGSEVSFIYMDPPYGREHYSRYYHVLETIALGDFPKIDNKNTMIRNGRYQSLYSIRSLARKAFEALLSNASRQNIPIALSYADDSNGDKVANRVMNLASLIEISRMYYNNVSVINIHDRKYSQFNSGELSSPKRDNSEVLIVAR
ncbi:DNA adenine methylase [Mesorhizobium sp. RIZ17]|uniref:DNA adenine methylase n=1 Tax=Mesorhizobium sp. RIZ17 TaxID=3132743 RepID=UPI003DA8925C